MPLLQEVLAESKGMNRISDRLNMPKAFLYDLLNGYVRKDVRSGQGVIVQRGGSVKLNSTALGAGYGATKTIRLVFEAKWDGGSTDVIIRAGTAYGKFDGSATFDTLTGLTGRTDDALAQAAMFKNQLLLVDGGVPQKLTSGYVASALSADANMPQDSDAVWVHRDKVWLNSAANPMKAYFSKTNAATGANDWTGTTDAGTIDLSTVLPTGDRIRGFRTFGGVDSGLIAIICDRYTVIYAAGANTYEFTFVQYFPTTCLSVNAADYVGTDIVYPSRDVLTSLISSQKNQQLDTDSLSKWVEPLYRSLASSVTTSQHISGAFHNAYNLYYINFPVSGNHQMLVYSIDVGNVVGRWTFPFNVFSMCERRNGDMLVGSTSHVYKINVSTAYDDDGTAISFRASYPALYFDRPDRYKKPIDFEALFIAENAEPTVQLDYWFGGLGLSQTDTTSLDIELLSGATLYYWDTALWDVSYWSDVGGSFLYRTSNLIGRGRFMVMDISQDTDDARLSIDFVKIGYVLEGAV